MRCPGKQSSHFPNATVILMTRLLQDVFFIERAFHEQQTINGHKKNLVGGLKGTKQRRKIGF